MSDGFKAPNFEKDPVRKILKKSWEAFNHRLDEVWDEIKLMKVDAHTASLDIASISGQLKIIIYMGGGVLTLLLGLIVVILDKG